jgi:hypothetical protein
MRWHAQSQVENVRVALAPGDRYGQQERQHGERGEMGCSKIGAGQVILLACGLDIPFGALPAGA